MTRAKTHLVLTWRREVSYFAGNSFKTKDADRSRFLNALVSKPDGKTHKSVPKQRSIHDVTKKDAKRLAPKGTRAMHTTSRRNNEVARQPSPPVYSSSNRTWDNWAGDDLTAVTTASGIRHVKDNNTARQHSKSPPARTERKSWDNWEPSQIKKTIQQVPKIKPMTSVIKDPQKNTTPSSQRYHAKEQAKKVSTPLRRQPSQSDSQRQQLIRRGPSHQIDKERSIKSEAPTDIDSTLFYPVGSSVKHPFYGRGTVQPPPKSNTEFAEKMLVRVKFVDESEDWDLPMDTLLHTYE